MLGKLMAGSLLAASLLLPAQAMAADNIGCTSTGYAPEVQRQIDNFIRDYRFVAEGEADLPGDLMDQIAAHVGECADQHKWSPEATESAVFYSVFDLLKRALIAHSLLTPAQLSRVDRTFADPSSAQARQVLRDLIIRSVSGATEREPSDEEDRTVSRIALRAGIPVRGAAGDFLGAYLATLTGTDHYAAQFSSQ